MEQKPTRRATTAEKHARERRAFELLELRWTYAEIGESLGVSSMQAWRDCQRYKARTNLAESLGEKRERLVGVVRRVQKALLPRVEVGGDSKAGGVIIKAVERESRLLGTDAPVLVAQKIQHVPSDTWRRRDEAQVVAALSPEDKATYLRIKDRPLGSELGGRQHHVGVGPQERWVDAPAGELPPASPADELAASCSLAELRVLEKARLASMGLPVPGVERPDLPQDSTNRRYRLGERYRAEHGCWPDAATLDTLERAEPRPTTETDADIRHRVAMAYAAEHANQWPLSKVLNQLEADERKRLGLPPLRDGE